ncbi:MAG: hypothetical protein C0483_02665 [Pirellula sp.]|nr:hypothetical protein [Pirellula sp.]
MGNGLRYALVGTLAALIAVVYFTLLREPFRSPPEKSTGSQVASASASQGASGTKTRKLPLDLPRAVSLPGAWGQGLVFVKPGHWSSVWVEGEADQVDYRGLLTTELTPEPDAPESLAVWGRLTNRRPVTFPKQEVRVVEQLVFAPNSYDASLKPQAAQPTRSRTHRLGPAPPQPDSLLRGGQLRLTLGEGLLTDFDTRLPVTTLRDHQSLLVVLAETPNAYRFWSQLPLVAAPHDQRSLAPEQQAHYRVVVADDSLRAPLPSLLEGWTTTSVVVWDRYDPARLSDAQRQALLDWLHWGGRLIVSGPDSLPLLAESFLAPYLPAETGGPTELGDPDLAPLDGWTIAGSGNVARPAPWRGARLRPADESVTLLGEGADRMPLVVERRVGRGHVLVTAFRMTEPALVDWPSYDSFVHGCLLGRPPRVWRSTPDPEGAIVRGEWADGTPWFEPARTSELCFASRQAGREARARQAPDPTSRASGIQDLVRGIEPAIGPGIAAWRDDDDVSQAARELLTADAGLTIPSVRFVLGLVAAYVVLLVPVNWLVFSRVGRAELAWVAAPLIAVGCSAYVVYDTKLDVGFVRTATEVAVVELQPGYPRAHVTRFGTIYNSLGHDYRFAGDDGSLVVLPVGDSDTASSERDSDKLYTRDDATSGDAAARTALGGLQVASNSTTLYRAEQLRDCGGSILCTLVDDGHCRLENGTPWELVDLQISGTFTAKAAKIGPGESLVLETSYASAGDAPRRPGSPTERLRAVVAPATIGDSLRVTAWAPDAEIETALDPLPGQVHRRTLVVARLEYPTIARQHERSLPATLTARPQP